MTPELARVAAECRRDAAIYERLSRRARERRDDARAREHRDLLAELQMLANEVEYAVLAIQHYARADAAERGDGVIQ